MDPILTQYARKLRKDMTPAECKLWKILRCSQLSGWKFRRQQPIPPYITDFCCFTVRIIVELDGDAHAGREEYDNRRDIELRSQGYELLRFENCEVMMNENRVVERIVAACRIREASEEPLTLNPSPTRGEGDRNKNQS